MVRAHTLFHLCAYLVKNLACGHVGRQTGSLGFAQAKHDRFYSTTATRLSRC